jgi:hypothetical protein
MCRARAHERHTDRPSLLAVTDPTGNFEVDRNPAWDAFKGKKLNLEKDKVDRQTMESVRS